MAIMYLPLLLSLSALIISILSFIFLRTYLKRRTGQERILAEFREEVNNILLTIDETTERDISLIEEREKKLKSLLEEIDKRLRLYVREMERHNKADETHAALSALNSKPVVTYADLGKKRYKGPLLPEITPDDESKPEAASPLINQPSKSEQIRSFLRSGLSEAAIASRLEISISEVEFAAALLERRDF